MKKMTEVKISKKSWIRTAEIYEAEAIICLRTVVSNSGQSWRCLTRWVWRISPKEHLCQPLRQKTKMRRRATPCGRCEKAVGKADNGLKCKWCHVWFHAECEGIPQVLQQALAEHQDQSLWYCTACQGVLKASVTKIGELERINRELEERIKEVEAREEGRRNEGQYLRSKIKFIAYYSR